jgi:hypothetical protein
MSGKKDEPESTAMTRRERYIPVKIVSWRMEVSDDIRVIRRYIETVTASFQRESQENEAYFAKQAENAHEDEIQSLAESWGEEAGLLDDHFPAFALQTTFVATYALLEAKMMALARVVGKHLGLGIGPEDLKDKGIFAAKKYFEKLCGVAFPASTRPWQEVLNYNRIRNVFAHSQGRV